MNRIQQIIASLFILVLCTAGGRLLAQDTLPRITVKQISSKVIISWRTTYGARITNINVQRSADSLRGFSTIGTVLEPNNRENGFVDNKAPDSNQYYRVFVAFQGGSYLFSRSYRPAPDTGRSAEEPHKASEPEVQVTPPVSTTKPVGFVPSRYVFTSRDNNVILDLPGAPQTQYAVHFFDEDDQPVFKISRVSEPYLIIEKVNFLHAGWYYFTLFENGIIKEKHRFYIGRDGRNGSPPPDPRRNR